MKFVVKITETLIKETIVEAQDVAEAKKIAQDDYNDMVTVLGAENFACDMEISARVASDVLGEMYGYIGRTSHYYDGAKNELCSHPQWEWDENKDRLAGDVYALTERGYNMLLRCIDNLGCSYDTRDEFLKGLSSSIREKLWILLTDENEEYSVKC